MDDKTYSLKKFSNGKYIEFDCDKVTLELNLGFFSKYMNEEVIKQFSRQYDYIKIPDVVVKSLQSILRNKQNSFSVINYLSLISITQDEYIPCFGKVSMDKIIKDYQNEKIVLKDFFDLLKNYLRNDDRNKFKSIKFLNDEEVTSITIKNGIVLHDIYEAIFKFYEITSENFEERTKEILEKLTNQYKLESLHNMVKYNFGKILETHFSEIIYLSDSDVLRRIIRLFELAQIKLNNKNLDKIIPYHYPISQIHVDEIKNLKIFLKREKSFLV